MCHPSGGEYTNTFEQQLELPGSEQTVPVYAYGYTPGEAKPTVVIYHDAFGATPFYRDMARRLAEQGFAAILPDFFFREGPIAELTMEAARGRAIKHNQATALQDLATIVNALSAEGRKVGIIGFCMGGRQALFAASRIPALTASVVYYGPPVNTRPQPNVVGDPIDEVAQIQAPILGFFGDQDGGIPVEVVRRYEQATREAGKDVNLTIYPGVGHAFMTFDFTSESPAAIASRESWARALTFLEERLTSA
jgi:carboxymethylenebutenolidase